MTDGACLELAGKEPAQPSGLSGANDSALIRRAQQGDRAAFDALVRLYDQNVLRLALQVVRSPEEARDYGIVDEVLLGKKSAARKEN